MKDIQELQIKYKDLCMLENVIEGKLEAIRKLKFFDHMNFDGAAELSFEIDKTKLQKLEDERDRIRHEARKCQDELDKAKDEFILGWISNYKDAYDELVCMVEMFEISPFYILEMGKE